MKTNLTSLRAALFLLALPFVVQAQSFRSTTANGQVTITGFRFQIGTNLTIPGIISTLPVTSIGNNAFAGESSLLGVKIPGSVTNIGNGAFSSCQNMTSLIISNGVISIGQDAFNGCNALTNFTLPHSVTNIGQHAFSLCGTVKSVSIGSSVTNIGTDAFSDDNSLTNITVDPANPAYSSLNGVLFDKAQATLMQYPGGLAGSYTIPNSVTDIGDAFAHGRNLTGLSIPNSVTSIGDDAFRGCSLPSVKIPTNVTSIGDFAFYDCMVLTNIVIPGSVTSIGVMAFYDCVALANIVIPGSVTNIGDQAFTDAGLITVTIPSSVTSIGNAVFFVCPALTNITVDPANPAYSSLNGVLFDKAQATLIAYPTGLAGSCTIPNSVTNISDSAFYDCPALTSVTIPNGITSIGGDAFNGCMALTNIVIPGSVTNIGGGAFEDCSNLTTVYFQGNAPMPDDGNIFLDDPAAVYHLAGTTGWDPTFGSVPAVLWNPQVTTSGFTGGLYGFNLTGPTNAMIVVEACTDLSHPVWLPVVTNTLSGAGTSTFSDPQSGGHPVRYYRFRSP